MTNQEERQAYARREFRKFRIVHPRLERIRREIEIMREVGRANRDEWIEKGRKGKRSPHKFLPIIGPSGSGKSTCIEHYIETTPDVSRRNDDLRPMLHVTLSAQARVKTLASDILEAYGDPDFEEGTAAKLMRRAANHSDVGETDLIVLDEIHHTINTDGTGVETGGKGGKTAWSVTETIKRWLIRGTCPLILIGTEEAKPLLLKNPQFKNRCLEPIFLNPLDVSLQEERGIFLDHCAGFDLKLVEHGIMKSCSGLIAGDIPLCMYDVSGGVIGIASNVFEVACERAIRRGARKISRDDLDEAVQNWAIPLGITDHNPFRNGVRTRSAT